MLKRTILSFYLLACLSQIVLGLALAYAMPQEWAMAALAANALLLATSYLVLNLRNDTVPKKLGMLVSLVPVLFFTGWAISVLEILTLYALFS